METVPAGYVAPARFVSLLRRLEHRHASRGGTFGGGSSNEPQSTPTPEAYMQYRAVISTAPARRMPELSRRTAASPPPADVGAPPLLLDPLAVDDGAGHAEATRTAFERHNAAAQEHEAHNQVVAQALDRDRLFDAYATTAEADEKANREAPPRVEPMSNLDAIENVLGINRRGAKPAQAAPAADPSVPADSEVESPIAAAKVRGKQSRSAPKNTTTVTVAAARFEPAEFVALRNRLAEKEAELEELRAEMARKLAEAALKADLENKALRFEAEQRAEELTDAINAVRQQSKQLREQLAEAYLEVDRLRKFERDNDRMTLQVSEARAQAVAAQEAQRRAQAELDAVPDRIAAELVAGQRALEVERGAHAATREQVAERDRVITLREARIAELEQERLSLQDGAKVADNGMSQLRDAIAVSNARIDELLTQIAGLEAERASFADQAEQKLRSEIDQSLDEARRNSEAYESVRSENISLAAELEKLRDAADAHESQRKTLKQLSHRNTLLQDQVADLDDRYRRLSARRMDLVYQNIGLRLQLGRVLRPNGLTDRLRALEAQNKWLFSKLNDATAMASSRLAPYKGEKPRLIALHSDDVEDSTSNGAASRMKQDGAGEPIDPNAVYIVDSCTQTTGPNHRSVLMMSGGGSRWEDDGFDGDFERISLRPASAASQQDVLSAREAAQRVRLSADVSIKHIETSPGPGRLTPSGIRRAADDALRCITHAPLLAGSSSAAAAVSSRRYDDDPLDLASRPQSAAAGRRERSLSRGDNVPAGYSRPPSASVLPSGRKSAAAASRREEDAPMNLPPRVVGSASSSTRRRRPQSALSAAGAVATANATPAVGLAVIGTTGPSNAVLASNPYGYFSSTSGAASSTAAASEDFARPPPHADGWMPTSYVVGAFNTVAGASAGPRRDTSLEQMSFVRSDDAQSGAGAAERMVPPLDPAGPQAKLPGGAWLSRSRRPTSSMAMR